MRLPCISEKAAHHDRKSGRRNNTPSGPALAGAEGRGSPFAKFLLFNRAPSPEQGEVIDVAHEFACLQGGVRPAGDYLRLSEAALAVGLEESDLLFLVRRHKVRLLRIRKNIYFRLAELREDLGSQIVPTAHLDGGISRGRQRRESHARKTAENAGQIQTPADGGM
jgi:hypothetical protein